MNITNSEEDSDQTLINIDYCYKPICNILLSYKEALNSSKLGEAGAGLQLVLAATSSSCGIYQGV